LIVAPAFGTSGSSRLALWCAWRLLIGLMLVACERTGSESVDRARGHAAKLVEAATRDVAEVREGLPLGATEFAKVWSDGTDPIVDAEAARAALERVRDKIQNLRVAKSTFFALAAPDGTIVRNDREQDSMAGRPLFAAFPALSRAASGAYVEALGVLPEAHGVKGKPDAEWIAANGIRVGDAVRGIYVTGWAWSSYAHRLEFALRGQVNAELTNARVNVPLLYVFVVVGRDVFGAPEAPDVNATAISERDPLSHLEADGSFGAVLEITGRTFALGVQKAPGLGPSVGIAVLRSET
jgi:hypothetical protein